MRLEATDEVSRVRILDSLPHLRVGFLVGHVVGTDLDDVDLRALRILRQALDAADPDLLLVSKESKPVRYGIGLLR